MPSEEVFLPFGCEPDRVVPASGVRGTVLASSLKALRGHGLQERYLAQLEPRFHDAIQHMIASAWLPLDVATAHYRACDALGLDRATIDAIGGEAGRHINETMLSVVLRLSREVGVSPWTMLARADRLVERSWQGTAIGVFKLGPKEARVEWIGQPLASIPYFRAAFRSFVHSLLQLFAERVVLRELPERCSATSLSYRSSWA